MEVEYYIAHDDAIDAILLDSCDVDELDLSKAQLIENASTNNITTSATLLVNNTTIHNVNSAFIVAINSIGCGVSNVIDIGKYFMRGRDLN